MTHDIVVCRLGEPLVIIRECPKYVLLSDIRTAYAKEFAFDEQQLTVTPMKAIGFGELKIPLGPGPIHCDNCGETIPVNTPYKAATIAVEKLLTDGSVEVVDKTAVMTTVVCQKCQSVVDVITGTRTKVK